MAEARLKGFVKTLKADPELDTKYCKKNDRGGVKRILLSSAS